MKSDLDCAIGCFIGAIFGLALWAVIIAVIWYL